MIWSCFDILISSFYWTGFALAPAGHDLLDHLHSLLQMNYKLVFHSRHNLPAIVKQNFPLYHAIRYIKILI